MSQSLVKERDRFASANLQTALDLSLAAFDLALDRQQTQLRAREVGIVTAVGEAVATATGLPNAMADELIEFSPREAEVGQTAPRGIAFNLDPGELGIVLLDSGAKLNAGDRAWGTGRVLDVPVGEALLGRVVDPTGWPLDGRWPIAATERYAIERPAPPFIERAPVQVPLQTGWKVIDAAVPIGRGQRELIVGDRQTGKTTLAVETIVNQKDKNVLCIYCAIGQRAAAVAKTIAELRARGAFEYCTVVVATGDDPPGLQYIAPYAATSIAEYFMARGHDVAIVYD
ncbi:MAG: F0F1 ATP synthase subunit alpha, partial [Cyanobacteria bacterium J06641_5]